MTNVAQWDPFTELRNAMDRLFEEGFSRPWRLLGTSEYGPSFPVEMSSTDDAIEIKAALPGVRPEDVNISVTGDVLTIKAEHPADDSEGRQFYRREIQYGSLQRSFNLPVSVDADKAQARYEHGMLYLMLPKVESVRPKPIKIAAPVQNGTSPR